LFIAAYLFARVADTDAMVGRAGGIRTPNIRFWRPALYQFELLP
jgi:hypothetical protein